MTKYRGILYFEGDSDEEYRLVTNIFSLPAQEIVSLYKKRWNIELFFKNNTWKFIGNICPKEYIFYKFNIKKNSYSKNIIGNF